MFYAYNTTLGNICNELKSPSRAIDPSTHRLSGQRTVTELYSVPTCSSFHDGHNEDKISSKQQMITNSS